MRRQLKLRTMVALGVTLISTSVVGLALYAVLGILPAGRALRRSVDPLAALFTRLDQQQQTLDEAVRLAEVAVSSGAPRDRDRLRSAVAGRDYFAGTLPLADVPEHLRIPVARAEDHMSRLVVLLDEIATLLELDRRAAAATRLEEVNGLRARVVTLVSGVQVRGLREVAAAQRAIDRLAVQFVFVCVGWLVVTSGIAGLTTRLVRRRVAGHLDALLDGLERVERGDLNVHLTPTAADELQGLAEEFNRMTMVLRDRAERLGRVAAAGELLAATAHEVNNPLMTIAATAEQRARDPELSAAARAEFDAVLSAAHRAARLLRAIVTFLKPGPGGVRPVVVNDVVRDTWELVSSQLRSDGVEGRLDLAPDLPPVVADPHSLEQLLVNLVANAHQAVMRVEPPRLIAIGTRSEGGRVEIRIRDTGPGVDDAARANLFRPFFSTAPDGRAGLGLYTSRLIAREAGGDVFYTGGAGRGAEFAVSLPAVPEAAAEPTRAGAEVVAEPPLGVLAGRRVLLVDDEVTVRRPIARYLAKRGANVAEASHGAEALSAVVAERPDVIVTDLRMPVLDGIAFYRELRQSRPDLAERVLFLSGDVAQLRLLDGEAVAPERVLTKPIDLAVLERRIAAQLT